MGKVWNAEVKEYSQRWQRYEWLIEHRSIANEFESGRIVGQTLPEVVMLLTIVWDGVGLAAMGVKALGEAPELARLTTGVAKENLQKVPDLARLASDVSKENAEGLLKALREKLRTEAGGRSKTRSRRLADPRRRSSGNGDMRSEGRANVKNQGQCRIIRKSNEEWQWRTSTRRRLRPPGWDQMPDWASKAFDEGPKPEHIANAKLYRVIDSDGAPPVPGGHSIRRR